MDDLLCFLKSMRDIAQKRIDRFLDRLDAAIGNHNLEAKIDAEREWVKHYSYCIFVAERISDLDRSAETCKARMDMARQVSGFEGHYIKANREYLNVRRRRQDLRAHLDRVVFDGEAPDYRRQMRMMQSDFLRSQFYFQQRINGHIN